MDIKQYTMMAVGLIVGVLLISGVVAPVISDTVSTDNAEVVNDFSESLAYNGVSSDYYNSCQYFFKDGNTGAPPDMIWGAEDFHSIVMEDESYGVHLFDAHSYSGDYPFVFVEWNTKILDNGTDVPLDEITLLYMDSVNGMFKVSDMTDFELRLHGFNVTSTFTYNDTPYTFEFVANEISYLSSNMNGWLCQVDEGSVLKDGSYVYLGLVYRFSDVEGWPTYGFVFRFDESAIEGNNYHLPPIHIVYNGTDYGEFSIVITSLRTLGEGFYALGVEDAPEYFDVQSSYVTSSDGVHEMTISGESWFKSYSTMDISPYVSYTPSEPISPTLVSLITIIPLLMAVGLVMAVVMFIKKD